MLDKETKNKIVEKFAKSASDTGSIEVQIGVLTERIKQVTNHLKEFKKDNHSRRGLLRMVGKRKSFLNYLKRNDNASFVRIENILKERGK